MLVDNKMTDDEYEVGAQNVGWPLKLLYTLAVLSAFPLLAAGTSGWVALATGGGVGRWLVILVLLFGIWRIFCIWRDGLLLDAPVPTKTLLILRRIGICLMVLNVVVGGTTVLQRPLATLLFPHGSDNGIEFFVLSTYAAFVGMFSIKGILVFELSRLMGFEIYRHREMCEQGTKGTGDRASSDYERESRNGMALYVLFALCFVATSFLAFLPVLALFAYRLVIASKNPNGLVRWTGGLPSWLRVLSIWLFVIGLLSLLIPYAVIFCSQCREWGVAWLKMASLLIGLSVLVSYCAPLFDFARLLGYERERVQKYERSA